MNIVKASHVADSVIYNTFKEGYSDYPVKLTMDETAFIERFFGREASREYSFIAFEGDQPVGLIFGAIQYFHDLKTMRCGAFAVIPSHRSKGIGKELFQVHKQVASDNGCKQLFLEVIKTNHRAVNFYTQAGYRPVYDYRLYTNEDLLLAPSDRLKAVEVDLRTVASIRERMPELHINWQGEFFTLGLMKSLHHYMFYNKDQRIGIISISESGTLHFIWVNDQCRQRGVGKAMLGYAQKELGLKKLSTVASNNILYEGFLSKLGFSIAIEQHEMMLVL